ncbi:MAG: hypothetical protein O3B76_03350 [Proteobacteria bacterium]|nr:hypothetical protein [Pseudomonadota bacterium]
MAKYIPTHPGEILKDEIEARGLTANRFAIEIGARNDVTSSRQGGRAVKYPPASPPQ